MKKRSSGRQSALRCAAVVLKSSRNKDLAKEFLAFIKTPDVARLMRSYGFALPEPTLRP
jgi:ABC-type molybdate transport system substrate-binding protein